MWSGFSGGYLPRATNIIDSNGRRYALINDHPDVPEQIRNYQSDSIYMFEPHESVLVTYLFEKVDDTAQSLDVHFISMNGDGELPDVKAIHVVLQ